MKMPSMPLLSQRSEIPDDMFCNNETMAGENCIENHCECYHGIKVSDLLHTIKIKCFFVCFRNKKTVNLIYCVLLHI